MISISLTHSTQSLWWTVHPLTGISFRGVETDNPTELSSKLAKFCCLHFFSGVFVKSASVLFVGNAFPPRWVTVTVTDIGRTWGSLQWGLQCIASEFGGPEGLKWFLEFPLQCCWWRMMVILRQVAFPFSSVAWHEKWRSWQWFSSEEQLVE